MENGKWKMENVGFLLPGSDFPGISLPLGEGGPPQAGRRDCAAQSTDSHKFAAKSKGTLRQSLSQLR